MDICCCCCWRCPPCCRSWSSIFLFFCSHFFSSIFVSTKTRMRRTLSRQTVRGGQNDQSPTPKNNNEQWQQQTWNMPRRGEIGGAAKAGACAKCFMCMCQQFATIRYIIFPVHVSHAFAMLTPCATSTTTTCGY